ncbi:toll-like receptor 21 [Heterodontus francisci]|uniref:toll-like receptor 21 n=1 Tax=Heterodontus francisci TaxID=7792 RepID=UPI00355C54BA
MLRIAIGWPLLLCALSCNVPTVPGYSFNNCIQDANHQGTFQCIHRFLTQVSAAVSDLPASTMHLNISHNLFSQLGAGSFRSLPKLNTLRLDYNRIERVRQGAFSNLTNLLVLNLSCNCISHLTPLGFSGLGGLAHLLLHHNRLTTIVPLAFAPLANLQTLVLRSNHLHNFSHLVSAVTALSNLTLLDLSNNHLDSLQHSTTLPPSLQSLYLCNNLLTIFHCKRNFLHNVSTLNLSNNKLSNALEFSKVDLRNISNLILKNNPLNITEFLKYGEVDLQKVQYSGLGLHSQRQLSNLCHHLGNKTMKRLVLQSNKISSLTAHSLSQCPPITSWDLSHNLLTSVGCLEFASKRKQVVSFILEHNRIQTLPSCYKDGKAEPVFPKLLYLSFRYNRIFTISSHAFAYALHLQTLMLNINNIAVIKKTAFSNLTSLQLLRLDNNLITDIYEDTFSDLRSLRILNLRNNRISIVFSKVFANLNNLEILDLGGNKIRSLTNLSFSGLYNLTKLYLDRNYIIHISRDIFSNLLLLKVLDLTSNQIRYNTGLITTSPFVNLTHLHSLKLQAQQPHGINIIPPEFFKGLVSLSDLYIGGNKLSLSKDVFEDLNKLRFLSMPDTCNGIHSLSPGIFKNLQNLERLDLENVGLRSMSLDILGNLSNLRTLVLGKNAIQTVNSTVVEHLPSLTYLDLRKNPFPCTCANSWFQNWSLTNPRVQVVYFYNQTCADRPTEYLYKFNNQVCYLDIGHLMFQITMPVLIIFMFIPIFYDKGYWHIKYGFYIFRSWLNDYRWREESQQNYMYDAFISYNSNDEDWVLQELVPNLETKGPQGFKLCLHHRDFELGKYIVDNIVDSIYQSRKTICVMSRNYLDSEWCSMELQLASYRLFHELKDIVILIFLEKVPDAELSAYHKMRKVMKKKTYIQWPSDMEAQKLFWVKVREAIKGSSCAKEGEPAVES